MNLDKFIAGLKAYLRAREYKGDDWNDPGVRFAVHEAGSWGSTQTGEYGALDYVDWNALEKEIDAFAASFKDRGAP